MTIAIIAADLLTAAQVADNLGLGGSWIYPPAEHTLAGYVIERIIMVDGWHTSDEITPEILQAVNARSLAADVEEMANPRENASTARLALLALDALNRPDVPPPIPALTASPFLDAYLPTMPRRRRSRWARLLAWLGLA